MTWSASAICNGSSSSISRTGSVSPTAARRMASTSLERLTTPASSAITSPSVLPQQTDVVVERFRRGHRSRIRGSGRRDERRCVKFSLWASNSRAWPELLDLATYVESVGWHGFWLPDHYMSNTRDDSPASNLRSTAGRFSLESRSPLPVLRLTSMVSPVTIHHPVVLAKRAVTVDQISDGRAVLGLGAGWQVNEHHGYGFELLRPPGERVSPLHRGDSRHPRAASTTSAPTSPDAGTH